MPAGQTNRREFIAALGGVARVALANPGVKARTAESPKGSRRSFGNVIILKSADTQFYPEAGVTTGFGA
jgi:hypothetical protein